MGGKKKRSVKQMAKAATKKPPKKKTTAASTPSEERKTIAGITLPNVTDEKTVNQLKKMKVITPHSVATRFNLRLSIARDFLRKLEQRGTIEFVSRSRNLQIYKPKD